MTRGLLSNQRGAAALEFALAAPIVILVLVGLARLGIMFMANAGLHNAIAEGARYATIYPLPTDQQITQRIMDSRFGLKNAQMTQPTIVHGNVNGSNYIDISVQYSVPMDFVFFHLPAVTLSENRRAFVTPGS